MSWTIRDQVMIQTPQDAVYKIPHVTHNYSGTQNILFSKVGPHITMICVPEGTTDDDLDEVLKSLQEMYRNV